MSYIQQYEYASEYQVLSDMFLVMFWLPGTWLGLYNYSGTRANVCRLKKASSSETVQITKF